MTFKKNIVFITVILLIIILSVVIFLKNKSDQENSASTGNIQIKDITPSGINAVRPDVVKIGNDFYVNFLETKPEKSLGLIRIDSNLNAQYLGKIYSGPNNFGVTDARMITNSNNNLWYPFEVVSSTERYLNLASYKIDSDNIKLLYYKDKIAQGSILAPEKNIIPSSGSEQTDDPLPFFYDGKYYVMTRTFQSPVYKVRVFDNSQAMIDNYFLSLSSVIGQSSISVNSLVKIENDLYMITGVFNNRPPGDFGAISKIVAIPLENDLRKVKGAKIDLTDGKKYSIYVSSTKYKNGKLYVLYNNLTGKSGGNANEGVLEIYDVKNNFSLIKSIVVNGGKMIDNHMTMEFMGNKLYVFYNTAEEKLKVRIIEE